MNMLNNRFLLIAAKLRKIGKCAAQYLAFLSFFLLLFAVPLFGQGTEEHEQNTYEADQLLEQARKISGNTEKTTLALQSLTLSREIRHNGGIIRAALFLGNLHTNNGQPEVALQFLLEAESKLSNVGSIPLQLAVNRALADLFLEQKLYGAARRYYKNILALEPDDLVALERAGDASLFDLRFDSAAYFYKPLINRFSNDGNNPRLVQIYQKLAAAYDQNRLPAKSLEYYRKIEFLIEHFGKNKEKALLYNNLGRQLTLLKDFSAALNYFKKAELQCKYTTCNFYDILYANIGIAMHNTGDSKTGIEYLIKALDTLKAHKDIVPVANLEQLLANVYLNSGDIYNALHHNKLAIDYAQKTKQKNTLANAYRTAADVHYELYDFEKAYDYYKKYLQEADSVRVKDQDKIRNLESQRASLSAAEGQIKYLITRQNFKELELAQSQFDRERFALLAQKAELEKQQKINQLELLQKDQLVKVAESKRLILEKLQAEKDLRIAAQNLDVEKQSNIIAALKRKDELQRTEQKADSIQRAQDFEIRQRDKNIAKLSEERQNSFRRFAYFLGGILLLILGLLSAGWILARRAGKRLGKKNKQIQEQNHALDEERQKSEHLLLNILPDEIAQELKLHGTAVPKHYESATVLFTDFVNFTTLSAQLTPDALIAALNECFLAFDEIAERNGLEKIKTIGDAYMCVGGLPVPNKTHSEDAVRAALEMVEWLERYGKESPTAIFREMRVGIHTGQVVAGVIGKNKFAYDVWGDAVNLAARLEEYGASNRVNISSATYEAIKQHFKCEYRGIHDVRNKGAISMYFVEGVTRE